MLDIESLKKQAIAKMMSAGMIHPYTGMEAVADGILDDFAKACFITPEVTYASFTPSVAAPVDETPKFVESIDEDSISLVDGKYQVMKPNPLPEDVPQKFDSIGQAEAFIVAETGEPNAI